MSQQKPSEPHFHRDERGVWVKCYHSARSLITDWRFWCGITFSFPFEHALWEHVPPFSYITHWLGL